MSKKETACWFIALVFALAPSWLPALAGSDNLGFGPRIDELERKVAGMQKQITILHATKQDKIVGFSTNTPGSTEDLSFWRYDEHNHQWVHDEERAKNAVR